MSFAQGTTVAVEKTRAEIEKLISKYGAKEFSSGWTSGRRPATGVLFFHRYHSETEGPMENAKSREPRQLSFPFMNDSGSGVGNNQTEKAKGTNGKTTEARRD